MSINKFNEDYLDKYLSLLSKEDFNINLLKQNTNGGISGIYELMSSSSFARIILQATKLLDFVLLLWITNLLMLLSFIHYLEILSAIFLITLHNLCC